MKASAALGCLAVAAAITGEVWFGRASLQAPVQSATGEAVPLFKAKGGAPIQVRLNGERTSAAHLLPPETFVGVNREAAVDGWLHVHGADWDGWVRADQLDGPFLQLGGDQRLVTLAAIETPRPGLLSNGPVR